MIGRTLGHYRIEARLGEGGMGVVYRALDTKLNRAVALKVLPQELTGDPVRRLRFQREAQAAAALNHPNICTIHEVGQADGVDYLVMELLEGQTLRERIGQRPMALKELLPIAVQVGEALEAAHGRGVLHRDLKPDNIFVTAQGMAKVLDFGLAKVLQPEQAGGGAGGEGPRNAASRLETISRELTLQGKVLGTVAYMSPEQAKGETIDRRSDLFSFGVVLYEMATGRLPFGGKSDVETLASIIRDVPQPASGRCPGCRPTLAEWT
jgi:serine/threonine protein kinase